MLKRFSTVTADMFVICRVTETAISAYERLGIKPWHHILIYNDLAICYVWDTRVVELAMPADCLQQAHLTYDVQDDGRDLVIPNDASQAIINACEAYKTELPLLYIDGELTSEERDLLSLAHY